MPSEADYAEKIRKLNQNREELITRKARLDVKFEQVEAELKSLVGEMAELGTSQETLEKDVADEEKSLAEQVAAYEAALSDCDRILREAESALEASN